jgi:hypothetical protein
MDELILVDESEHFWAFERGELGEQSGRSRVAHASSLTGAALAAEVVVGSGRGDANVAPANCSEPDAVVLGVAHPEELQVDKSYCAGRHAIPIDSTPPHILFDASPEARKGTSEALHAIEFATVLAFAEGRVVDGLRAAGRVHAASKYFRTR